MKYLKSQNKATKAFTLAEVLITLTIIGVIAALTIPAIINSTQEAEYNVALARFMSNFSAAVRMIQTNNGGSVAVGLGTATADYTAFRDDFCNVMMCTKKDTEKNVFGGITYKYYKAGDFATFNGNSSFSAILNDGTLLDFETYGSCGNNGVNACGYVYVDINGQKGPNMLGKDLYLIYVVNNNGFYSALPLGTPNDSFKASTSCVVGNGRGCAYYRLTDPSKMP